jgi:hypothetical protein
MCSAGLLVIFLSVFDDFIPRAIKLGEQAIRIGNPGALSPFRIETSRYAT